MAAGVFANGSPLGILRTYHRNRKPQAEIEFKQTADALENYLISYFDSTGVQQIAGGNGLCHHSPIPFYDEGWSAGGELKAGVKVGRWEGTDSMGCNYTEEYESGKLVNGAMICEGIRYHYTEMRSSAH